ncbi:MAG: MATE family efflux transporter [Lachnospiraceae bacterium]|nr:MATE family efflux transporter [Lachnospiraceae bacterium]
MRESTSLNSRFIRYVSRNMAGMIGVSLYILADTYFISRAEGSNGVAALNLVLPIYGLLFAIGSMIGVGSAIRFSLLPGTEKEKRQGYFSNALTFCLLFGLLFTVLGVSIPGTLLRLLGGDPEVVRIGIPYTRIFMLFSPFFMMNYVFNAFTRNDNAPTTAMLATLVSSLFNIVMDYILMFPLGMGMSGAALATAISPVIGSGICCIHILSKGSSLKIRLCLPSLKLLLSGCQLGIAAFIGELSSAVTTMVFNYLLLAAGGTIAVAAYGVIANVALVAVACFNGIAQGTQPLISDYCARRDRASVNGVLRRALLLSLLLAGILYAAMFLNAERITAVFNSEGNPALEALAVPGIRLYFIGLFFAGINITGTGILSAAASARWASLASVMRGIVAIVGCALLLAALFGITGIWLAFPGAELLTLLVTLPGLGELVKGKKKEMPRDW